MESRIVTRSVRLDAGAGCVLVMVGVLHAALVLGQPRFTGAPLLRVALLTGAALMIVGGSGHVVSLYVPGALARIALVVAVLAAVAGIILSVALLGLVPRAPQSLAQLMVFGVALVLALTRPDL